MKKILKVTSILGVATLVKIITGMCRAKFLAWQIGPTGIGLVGQALMYSLFTIQLCSLSMGMGITKNISEDLSQKKDDKIPPVVNTAGTLQFFSALLFIIFMLPFSRVFTKFIFSDYKYWIYFVGITLATPFAVYLSGMADPILFGFRKITEYSRLMVLYAVIGLFLIFILVPFYKTEGMFVQIILISIIGFLLSYYFIRKQVSIKPKLNFRLYRDDKSRHISVQLFQYGFISFLPGITSMGALLYLRSLLIKQFGIEANGYYQVAYAMSVYYLPFVMNGLWGHFYPQMCALRTNRDINREINQFIRFTLFASTIIVSGLIIFRKYIILALYTREFLNAYDLLAIQGIGDIFFILFCMFSTSLMARKKFKGVVLMSTLGYNAALLALYYILTNFSGFNFRSLNIAIALANISFVIVYMFYYKVDTGFLLAKKNFNLFIKSMLLIIIIYFIPDINVLAFMIKVAVSLAWLILAVTRDEVKDFAGLVFNSFKKNANR